MLILGLLVATVLRCTHEPRMSARARETHVNIQKTISAVAEKNEQLKLAELGTEQIKAEKSQNKWEGYIVNVCSRGSHLQSRLPDSGQTF